MKINRHRLRVLFGLAAISGFAMAPLAAHAQGPDSPRPPAADGQNPDFQKVRGMVREMMELRRDGKHDEAAKMAERIKAATNNNPRVAEMLDRHPNGPRPDRQADEPRKPMERPKAKEREKESREKEMKAKEREKESREKAMKAKEREKESQEKAMKAKEGKEESKDKAAHINPVERIRHLRVAADHLDAAGIEGMAKVVRAHIEVMEKHMKHADAPKEKKDAESHRDRASAKERPMRFGQRPDGPPMRPGPRFGGFAPYRGGFQGPGAQAKPPTAPADPNAALIGEIRKLRQEMGELRGQVQRLQAHATKSQPRPHAPKPPVEQPR